MQNFQPKGYRESWTVGLRSDGPKQIRRGKLAGVTVHGGGAMAGQEELVGDLEDGPRGRRIANQGPWKIEEEATNSPRRFTVVKSTRKVTLGDGSGGDGDGARA